MDNIAHFIIHYDGSEIGRIGFSSNGKDGDDWCDANAEYRNRVTACVLLYAIEVPGLLIKDLFRAAEEFCREVWGSTPNVTRLGKMLLEKTGEIYIEDYFLGREKSFGTQKCRVRCNAPYGVAERTREKGSPTSHQSLTRGAIPARVCLCRTAANTAFWCIGFTRRFARCFTGWFCRWFGGLFTPVVRLLAVATAIAIS